MQNTGGLLFVWEMSLDLIPNSEGGERKGERDRERKSETGEKRRGRRRGRRRWRKRRRNRVISEYLIKEAVFKGYLK